MILPWLGLNHCFWFLLPSHSLFFFWSVLTLTFCSIRLSLLLGLSVLTPSPQQVTTRNKLPYSFFFHHKPLAVFLAGLLVWWASFPRECYILVDSRDTTMSWSNFHPHSFLFLFGRWLAASFPPSVFGRSSVLCILTKRTFNFSACFPESSFSLPPPVFVLFSFLDVEKRCYFRVEGS